MVDESKPQTRGHILNSLKNVHLDLVGFGKGLTNQQSSRKRFLLHNNYFRLLTWTN